MLRSSWLPWNLARQHKGRARPGPTAALRRRTRLAIEQLEDRSVPTNFTAATVSDLIADIRDANLHGGSNTITLTAPTTSPYTLTAGQLSIAANDNLTIQGNGDTIERSTASGTPGFRLFDVAVGASLTLANLTLQGGRAPEGGAIFNQGALTLSAVTLQNNSFVAGTGESGAGGAIYSNGSLTLGGGTVIRNNSVQGGYGLEPYGPAPGGAAYGGGVYVAGGRVAMNNVAFSGNAANGGIGGTVGGNAYGGALYVASGVVTLTNVTLSSNTVAGGGGRTAGGNAYGGALYVADGTVTLRDDTVTGNSAQGGPKGFYGAKAGKGYGGGLYIDPAAIVYIDAFTLANTTGNKPNNIDGSYVKIA